MTDQPAPKSPAFHHITDLLTANFAFPSQTADQIALLLVEDEDALLAALGDDNTRMVATPDKDVDDALIRAERAEAERDRLGEVASELYEALSDLRALEQHHAAWDGGVGFSGVLFQVRRSVDVALESYRALDGEDS